MARPRALGADTATAPPPMLVTPAEAQAILRRTIPESLPILLAGAAPVFLAFEVFAGGALYIAIGPRLPTLLAVAVLVTVVHPLAVWLTSLDPLCLQVFLRSLTRDFYPARPELDARARAVHPSIPHVR